ncbi:MAG: response regulator [Ramlibacter sp.]|nr:response regulator [Ramlibacter sp.]
MRGLPTVALAPSRLAESVLLAQVASLFATIRAATLADGAVAMVFGAVMYWQLRNPLVLVWMALHLGQNLRLPLLTAYFRDPEAASRSPFWARLYSREVLINSSVWGLAPLMFLPAGNLSLTSLMMLVMMGICASGALSVAPLKQALFCYVVPMMLGLTVALALHADVISLFLAACGAGFLGMTLTFAAQQHRMLTEALVTRFEKEALAEQLRAQVAATQRISEEKTRFLSAASHDLRQPLHAIALFGAVLEKDLVGHASGTHAARLMRAVNALGKSLDSMLDVSRLDAGLVTPVLGAVPLQPLFQSINHVFSARASEKDLQLRLRSSPLWVRSDMQLLQRLLSNLVDNALKYTVSGGVLVLARQRGEEIWIDVRDTGIGIAPEQMERIFEEFYQVDNPGRDRAYGLGIGLSIVQRLSRLLGHAVQVQSRPGRGSRFRVVLPRAEPTAAATSWSPDTSGRFFVPARRLPRRVLIVDDENDIREAMLAVLQSYSVEASAVADETQAETELAQAIAGGRPYEALLCDYRLAGGADGLSAGQRLQRRFGPTLALLLITGETAPERLQRVRDSRVPVLFKPVGAKTLMQALADCAAG